MKCVPNKRNSKLQTLLKKGKSRQRVGDDCPDGSSCDDGSTCCELDSGGYGCCPYDNATCCSDKEHCCPNGYTCDIPHMKCVPNKKNGKIISMLQVKQRKRVGINCDDGSSCDDGTTCCPLGDGSYGCCPYPDADCCSDKAHCCPNGYLCDIPHMKCVQNGTSILISKVKTNLQDCPSGTCDSDQTCCQLANGDFGCCPYSDADCCSDKAHCCPNGYLCDIPDQKCVHNGTLSIILFKKLNENENLKSSCPIGTCDSDQTCCEISRGWGCCPYARATCCSDKAHCCPKGYTCDFNEGTCVNQTSKIAFHQLKQSLKQDCPDGNSCDDGNTCCQLENGDYGCCPYDNAACCQDKAHCCPNGYNCDMAKQQCVKSGSKIFFPLK
jgi:hypothetical protein